MKLIKNLLIVIAAISSVAAPVIAAETVAVGDFKFVDQSGNAEADLSAWNAINEREFSFLLAQLLSVSENLTVVDSALHANFVVSGEIIKLNGDGDAEVSVFVQARDVDTTGNKLVKNPPRINVGSVTARLESSPDAIIALVDDAVALTVTGLQRVESQEAFAMP